MTPGPLPPTDPRAANYSVVIPVFNSEGTVRKTVEDTVAFFESQGLAYEIILVNDGSQDDSWTVVKGLALANPRITAVNLLRNYGQHNANLCGFRHATGDYVITMDDDGQNPPGEIIHLIRSAAEGNDLVFGRYRAKEAHPIRILGSWIIGLINRRIFGQPSDLTVSNFRIIRRDVVDRICASRQSFPYITGLALINSRLRANVPVLHRAREQGGSNYTLARVFRLVMTILFSYSLFPLRFLGAVGLVVSTGSFLIGCVYLTWGLLHKVHVQGWTTVVVLLAFLNGMTILLLSMLGEYVVRILNQTSQNEPYHVIDTVSSKR